MLGPPETNITKIGRSAIEPVLIFAMSVSCALAETCGDYIYDDQAYQDCVARNSGSQTATEAAPAPQLQMPTGSPQVSAENAQSEFSDALNKVDSVLRKIDTSFVQVETINLIVNSSSDPTKLADLYDVAADPIQEYSIARLKEVSIESGPDRLWAKTLSECFDAAREVITESLASDSLLSPLKKAKSVSEHLEQITDDLFNDLSAKMEDALK